MTNHKPRLLIEGFHLHSRVTHRIFSTEAPMNLFYLVGWGSYNFQMQSSYIKIIFKRMSPSVNINLGLHDGNSNQEGIMSTIHRNLLGRLDKLQLYCLFCCYPDIDGIYGILLFKVLIARLVKRR